MPASRCADHPRYAAGCIPCRTAARRYADQWRRDAILRRPSRRVPAIGAIRRVRALQALGWSQTQIGEAMGGATQQVVSTISAGSQEWMPRAKAERVAAAYEALSMRLPPEGPRVAHIRALAHRRGWAPPLAWDDIDRDEAPSPWARRSENPRLLADPMAVEDVVHFAALGLSDPEIAVRVGLSARTVLRIRQREGIPSLRRSA